MGDGREKKDEHRAQEPGSLDELLHKAFDGVDTLDRTGGTKTGDRLFTPEGTLPDRQLGGQRSELNRDDEE